MVPSSSSTRPLVLIVEDEPIVCLVAHDVLEDAGFDVLEATSAAEALSVLDARRDIALLFTDVHMPGGIDGLSLARMVPDHWPWLKVAVTSGRARPERSELPPGALFVPKPYHPDWLVKELQKLVSGGSAA